MWCRRMCSCRAITSSTSARRSISSAGAESKSLFLAANLRHADGSQLPGHQDRKIYDLGPVKVGVFGVALAATPLMSSADGFKFTRRDDRPCASSPRRLREEGADIVVAVTHTDFTRDIEIARSRLVDVLLTGHDHDLRISYDGRTAMVESGEEGEYVTAIDMYCTIAAEATANAR
jgi:5'-nucleotidase/UDP-sugar diphosphatase